MKRKMFQFAIGENRIIVTPKMTDRDFSARVLCIMIIIKLHPLFIYIMYMYVQKRYFPLWSKQLNGLLTIDTVSWLGGAVVTLWVQEFPGSIPGSGKGFYVSFFALLLLCFYFFVKNTLFVTKFAIPFTMLIYLAYLTYCKICDRL